MNKQAVEVVEQNNDTPSFDPKQKSKRSRVDNFLTINSTNKQANPFDQAQLQNDNLMGEKEKQTDAIPPKKMKPKRQGQYGLLRETLGIMIVALLVVGTWFNFTTLNQYKNTMGLEQMANAEQLGSLSQRFDESTVTTTALLRRVNDNAVELGKLQTNGAETQLIDEQLRAIEQMMDKLTTLTAVNSKASQNNQSSIERLKGVIGNKSKTKGSANTAQQTKAVTPLQQRPKIYQLEDATLVSIDIWGSSVNAMMRSVDNRWIPLAIGELFKGWRFTSTEDNQALFSKNGKTITLSIKE